MTTPEFQAKIRDLLGQLDRMRRVLLVHPDQVQRVREAVNQLPPSCAPGLIEVRASSFVPLGSVILTSPNFPFVDRDRS